MEPAMILIKDSKSGITLMEVIVASILAVVILVALTQIDLTRMNLGNRARNPGISEAPLALANITRQLERSDRVVLPSADDVQFRYFIDIPANRTPGCQAPPFPATCLDDSANYRWGEFRHAQNAQGINFILFFDDTASGCATDYQFRDINNLAIQFQDATPAAPPPGGDPAVQDNNMILISVSSLNPQDPDATILTYTGEVAARGLPYSDVGATGVDSGSGTAAPGISNPPAQCCPGGWQCPPP
jgi:hypothetical protein